MSSPMTRNPDADALTIVSATGPNGKGSLSVIDNKLVFDPGQDFQALSSGQSEAVELTYTVKDALGAQSTAKVMVSIIGLADAPAPDVIGDGTGSLGVIYGKGGQLRLQCRLAVDLLQATASRRQTFLIFTT